jgi:hypothetical protein
MATINQEQIHVGPSPGEIDAQGATGSVNSLSPLGERVGVRGLRMSIDIERAKPLTPPLSLREREQTEPAATL